MDCTPSPFPFPSLPLPFCCAVLTVVQSVGSPRRCRLGWPADRLRSAAVACTHVAMACRWLRTACARPPFTRLRHLRVGVRCSSVFIARLRSAVARLCSTPFTRARQWLAFDGDRASSHVLGGASQVLLYYSLTVGGGSLALLHWHTAAGRMCHSGAVCRGRVGDGSRPVAWMDDMLHGGSHAAWVRVLSLSCG